MTTETPNYLTAKQERVINDFQRVARELMVDGITTISIGFNMFGPHCYVHHSGGQCFTIDGYHPDLVPHIDGAIHKCRTEIKSPAEQAQIEYDRAMKAAEEAKAKLDALS